MVMMHGDKRCYRNVRCYINVRNDHCLLMGAKLFLSKTLTPANTAVVEILSTK